jgi:hypothetical protein
MYADRNNFMRASLRKHLRWTCDAGPSASVRRTDWTTCEPWKDGRRNPYEIGGRIQPENLFLIVISTEVN